MEVKTIEKLVSYYKNNKLSHAYLIETNNTEKCLEELILVIKKITCEQEYSETCTLCNFCNLINQGFLPSLKVIEPDGALIKKEQILALKRDFSSFPVYTKENIYVIKNAEKMTSTSANTMLKFLEEPPEHIYGFFITDNISNVISTIKSICEIIKCNFDMQLLSLKNINEPGNKEYYDVALLYLEKLEIEKVDEIMYNKDVILSKFSDRESISKVFKMILLIYESLYSGIVDENIALKFKNLSLKDLLARIKLVTSFLDDLKYNANIELLLDRFVIEMGDLDG